MAKDSDMSQKKESADLANSIVEAILILLNNAPKTTPR
jgi:hypothetical protein